jgi:23S rRNA (cytidine2498-2'-O)-methyltransferase
MTEPLRAASAAAVASGSSFLLVTCHPGGEDAVFLSQQQFLPEATRAAWRRGVVTFRLPETDALPEPNRLPFARTIVHSLGQVTGSSLPELATAAAAGVTGTPAHLHVWQRDATPPRASRRSQPVEPLPSAAVLHAEIATQASLPTATISSDAAAGSLAEAGDAVLDVIIDSPGRAWLGWHPAAAPASCWPGGVYPEPLPDDAVSRAWLKLDEAIASFAVPLRRGQRACELGAAPGGASQRMLSLGLQVVGIDPAEIDPAVASHPQFEHWKMRARDVRLRQLRGFDWLVTDMNIDPASTMDALERVATAPGSSLRGIIATLKLPQWSRAEELPGWLERFANWGFDPEARQLSSGGREVCVVARKRS